MDKPTTPEPLMRMVSGLWITQTLAASVELGIYSKIATGISTVGRMAEALGTESRPVEALLNACVALGLLRKHAGGYSCSELSEAFLVKGKPKYYGDFVEMLSKRSLLTWRTLTQSILANAPMEETLQEAFGRDPQFAALFTRAMHNNAVGPASRLPDLVDFSPYRKVLDLGGGSGVYSIFLAKKYSHLEAIVLDFPPVCEVAQEYIERFGVSPRVRTMAGDLFAVPLPQGIDAVILGQLLHSYSVGDCRRILDLARNAMRPGGLLVVLDFFLDDDKSSPLSAALFGLNMIVGSRGGNAYSWGEVRELLTETGYSSIEAKQLAGPVGLMMARRG